MLHSVRMIETLESRRLLTVNFSNGIVTVTGTSADDVVSFEYHSDILQIVVTLNGSEKRFAPGLVTKFVVSTGDGNDRIEYSPANGGLAIPSLIDAGAGNDIVIGGPVKDTIHGGDGNDHLEGSFGSDVIFGEGGNDSIYGDNGNDILRGGDGNDKIRGGAHNDSIDGGAGDDDLYGDAGTDSIWGGAGNDDFALRIDARSEIKDLNSLDNGNNTNL
jgi:Ca2+-binding RTX toxin-like protein